MPFLRPSRKSTSLFPLSVAGRFLRYANGQPALIVGDTPWMMPNQLTNIQIDTYLADRVARGFTAILFEAPGAKFTSQTPTYNNADGVAPFTSTGFTTCTFESLVTAYWNRVDYIVNQCATLGLICFITPAYLGFGGGVGTSADEGYNVQLNAASGANLQTYGATLATRYTQGNIVWVLGGDYDPPTVAKCWNIPIGMRGVRPGDIICFHGGRQTEGYTDANTQAGFNLNSIYCLKDGSDAYSLAATAYARGLALVLLESGYEGDASLTEMRRSHYGAMLSGACGTFFGNVPIWGFGEANFNGGAGAAASLSSLSSTGAQQMSYLKALLSAYAWQLLVPKTDASLVSTSLGTGTGRVCPAIASDGSFALIFSPSVNVTLVMTAFSKATVRVRLFDPTTGLFTVFGTFANTGTQSVTVASESVVVCD